MPLEGEMPALSSGPLADDIQESLSYEQKNEQLFLRQKKLLDMFLERHVISQAQYNTSPRGLQAKTGFTA